MLLLTVPRCGDQAVDEIDALTNGEPVAYLQKQLPSVVELIFRAQHQSDFRGRSAVDAPFLEPCEIVDVEIRRLLTAQWWSDMIPSHVPDRPATRRPHSAKKADDHQETSDRLRLRLPPLVADGIQYCREGHWTVCLILAFRLFGRIRHESWSDGGLSGNHCGIDCGRKSTGASYRPECSRSSACGVRWRRVATSVTIGERRGTAFQPLSGKERPPSAARFPGACLVDVRAFVLRSVR